MKPRTYPRVLAWLHHQPASTLFLSSISIAEIRFGLYILPEGQRRRGLEEAFLNFLQRGFEGRILPFDEAAAEIYAELMARRRRLGRPMSALDGQIAAIARIHEMALATRNIRDFEECSLQLIDPSA